MATVQVRLPTVLRTAAEGQSQVSVDGDAVGQVVDQLIASYPGLGDNLIGEDGQVRKFVNIYLNDEDIRFLEKLETPVADGDELAILPAVAGGQ
ncbi:MAG: ubiquitin-like small modifier protein 1 [Acidimicrobiales bacterium]